MDIYFDKKNPMPEWVKKKTELRENVLKYLQKGSIGCEIGVYRGHFSEKICSYIMPKKLYLIDPWRKLGKTFNDHENIKLGKGPYTNYDQLTTKDALDETKYRVEKFKNSTDIVFIEDFFPSCVDSIKDTLDWVYLDSSHEYNRTLSELYALDKILPKHGILIGDDFVSDPSHGNHQVTLAVNEFIKNTDWYICLGGEWQQFLLRRK